DGIRDFHVTGVQTCALPIFLLLVVGLELKRELVLGELASIKDATLPILAAAGGMLAPAVITLVMSWGEEGSGTAWAVPMATDIRSEERRVGTGGRRRGGRCQ